MVSDEQKEQHKIIVTEYDAECSDSFQMITGVVESEKDDIIEVKGKLHDIAKAMIINEKGNILREGSIFYGREVAILYHFGKVISVKLL